MPKKKKSRFWKAIEKIAGFLAGKAR